MFTESTTPRYFQIIAPSLLLTTTESPGGASYTMPLQRLSTRKKIGICARNSRTRKMDYMCREISSLLNYQPWEMGRGDYIPDTVFQEYPGIPELWEIIFGQKSPMFLSLLLTLLIASVYWTGQSRTRCHLSPHRPGHSGKSLYMQSIPFLTL